MSAKTVAVAVSPADPVSAALAPRHGAHDAARVDWRGVVPPAIHEAGEPAVRHSVEFFVARLANASTRATYARAVGQFCAWCSAAGLPLPALTSPAVAASMVMTFSRRSALPHQPSATELSARLAGIGMNLAVEADVEAHIEETLLHASEAGMDSGDLRVLAILTTWLGLHHAHVNADVLVRLVAAHPSHRVKAYWAAVAQWIGKDRRLRRLIAGFAGPGVDLLPVGTDFQRSLGAARTSGFARPNSECPPALYAIARKTFSVRSLSSSSTEVIGTAF